MSHLVNEVNRRTRRPNNTAKGRLVGNRAGQPAPAWKPTPGVSQTNGPQGRGNAASESRIFLSRLPIDVAEKEVEVSAYRF
jgi:THO complex subunit 4